MNKISFHEYNVDYSIDIVGTIYIEQISVNGETVMPSDSNIRIITNRIIRAFIRENL